MARKSFEVDGDPALTQPEEFDIVGSTSSGERFVETFSTVLELPLGVVDDVAMSVEISDGKVRYSRTAVLALIRAGITEKDRERWDALLRDPDRIVKLDSLVPVMRWLIELTSGRPTGPPSNSDGGSQGTSNGSVDTSSQKDTPVGQ